MTAFSPQVDLLAVTIGNVHGPYALEPQLDFARLEAIRSALPPDMPLVLHGASGLGPELIRGAMARGVCKFNVNTDMREAALRVQQDMFGNSSVKKVFLLFSRHKLCDMMCCFVRWIRLS